MARTSGAIEGGGAGYASLTGAGESETPGYLVQAGGLTVNDPNGDGINVQSTNGSITLTTPGTNGIVSISSQAIGMLADTPSPGTAIAAGIGELLGFFDTAPVAQPAAPVTLADVIAALQTLGLVAT
jgi:hypothetical protein